MAALVLQPGTSPAWPATAGLIVSLLLVSASLADAQSHVESRRATSSGRARRQAIAAVPLKSLSQEDRREVQQVLQKTSIYRRLPTTVVECDPHLFSELMMYPEVVTELWQEMGISKMEIRRTGPNSFDVSDGMGTNAQLRMVHNTFNKRVIVGSGIYDGPAFPRPLKAECVLLVQSRALRETDGRDFINCRMDSFLHVDGPAVELLAKAFQPLLGKTADHNFVETLRFVNQLHKTSETKPEAVARVIQRLDNVQPLVLKRVARACYRIGAEPKTPSRVVRVGRPSSR